MIHHKDVDLKNPEWWHDGFIRNFRKEAYKSLEWAAAVSHISTDGFWVVIYYDTDDLQKTHKEKLYVSTECFPYFQEATADEIEEVLHFPHCKDDDGEDVLYWKTLGLTISVATIKEGKECKKPLIRGTVDKWQPTETGWERK